MCALMVSVAELEIESPNMRWPGQKPSAPLILQSLNVDQIYQSVLDRGRDPDNPPSHHGDYKTSIPPATESGGHSILRSESRGGLSRSRSRSGGKKVDFSLGVQDIASSDDSGDVFDDNQRGNAQSIHLMRVLEEVEEERDDETVKNASRGSSFDRGTSGVMSRRRSRSASVVSHRGRLFGGRRSSTEADDVERGVATAGPSSQPQSLLPRGASAGSGSFGTRDP